MAIGFLIIHWSILYYPYFNTFLAFFDNYLNVYIIIWLIMIIVLIVRFLFELFWFFEWFLHFWVLQLSLNLWGWSASFRWWLICLITFIGSTFPKISLGYLSIATSQLFFADFFGEGALSPNFSWILLNWITFNLLFLFDLISECLQRI